MQITIDNEKYLDLEEVVKITGINQTYIYTKMKYEDFPKPKTKVVSMPRKRSLWKLSEIESYLESMRKK